MEIPSIISEWTTNSNCFTEGAKACFYDILYGEPKLKRFYCKLVNMNVRLDLSFVDGIQALIKRPAARSEVT